MKATKPVTRARPAENFSAHGVRVGDLLSLSAQVSLNEEGAVVGVGDLGRQVRQIFGNVRRALDAFGLSPEHIIDEACLVTNMREMGYHVDRFLEIRAEVLGRSKRQVTHSFVEVPSLTEPDLLIEIRCLARL